MMMTTTAQTTAATDTILAIDLHAHARKRATFIGEESGGGYYGNTSGPNCFLVLPNTKRKLPVPARQQGKMAGSASGQLTIEA